MPKKTELIKLTDNSLQTGETLNYVKKLFVILFR